MAENGEFSFKSKSSGRKGLPKILTQKNRNDVCHDDSGPTVKAQTIDELHSLQKKKSAPTTPIHPGTPFSPKTEEERQKQQLQSIR